MTIDEYNIIEFKELNDDYLMFLIKTYEDDYMGLCDYDGNVVIKPEFDEIELLDGTNMVMLEQGGEIFYVTLDEIKKGIDYKIPRLIFHNYYVDNDTDNEEERYVVCYERYRDKRQYSPVRKYFITDSEGTILLDPDPRITIVDYKNAGMFNVSFTTSSSYWFNAHDKSFYKCEDDFDYNSAFYGGYIRLSNNGEVDYMDTHCVYKNLGLKYGTNFIKNEKTGEYTAIIQEKNDDFYKVINNKFETLFKVNSKNYRLEHLDFSCFTIEDKKTGLCGVLNKNGEVVVFLEYKQIKMLSNGIICAFDRNDDIIYYSLSFDKLDFDEGIAFERINNEYVLGNKFVISDDGTRNRVYTIFDSNGDNILKDWYSNIEYDEDKNRILVSNKEVCLEGNNPYEYMKYVVYDFSGNVIFTLPKKGEDITLCEVYTDNFDYYIAKTISDIYYYISSDGEKKSEVGSDSDPTFFGYYFATNVDWRYYLYRGDGTPMFLQSFDLISNYQEYNGEDYINIINDRCFEYSYQGEHLLLIDKGSHYDKYDFKKTKNKRRFLFFRR